MGNQQTKYSGLRFSFLVLLLSFAFLLMGYGYCLLGIQENLQSSPKHVNAQATKDLYWGKDIKQDNLTRSNNAFYVNTAGGLAYLNYLFSRSANTSVGDSPEDYSNYTIYLTSNIELNNVPLNLNGGVENIDPLWIPFEIGKFGKHRNITFDGAGFTISGLHIKYEITDGQEPRNIGFFSEMYGGVFKNVTFKNPVIEYEYVGNSLAKDDPARPDAPIEVGVGVIAGCADSTYIENVKIENPSITVTTENSNGHNFYVGSAVGKMNFTSKIVGEGDDKKQESINTVTPTQWGINTVNVVKTDTESTGLNFTINQGQEVDCTYGEAFNAYLGGLVGVNVNSKVVNSTLHSLPIAATYTPTSPEAKLAGTYYVGGLVGLSTQIVENGDLIVAAGLYNNLLVNVSLNDVCSVTENNYCGNLVGRVYSGGWLYNNMVIGTMPYDLWGQVYNSIIRHTRAGCIGHIIGGLDNYYLEEENMTYSECDVMSIPENPYGDDYYEHFIICTKHSPVDTDLVESKKDSGAVEVMSKYNYHFESTGSSEFEAFKNGGKTIDGSYLSNFELMNYFKTTDGFMYHAVQPILEYEVGLTVNEIDAGSSMTDEEKKYTQMVDAIYQFRSWEYDEVKKEPVITDFTGLDYQATFEANSPSNSRAYWIVNENGWNEEVAEIKTGRTYQKISAPEEPICEGYKFLGWKVKGLEEGSDLWDLYVNKGYIDIETGFYVFGKEELLKPDHTFVAIWKLQEYKVTFVVREQGVPDAVHFECKAYYGTTVSKPADAVSQQGYKFVGWFLDENLPEEGQDADSSLGWVFGADGNKMPGKDIILYSGWVDNINMLRGLISEESIYYHYYSNYQIYFEDTVGEKYYNAFKAALAAKESTENLTVPVATLLTNLENAFNDLRVDPTKLLKLPAFDENELANVCPFLYKEDVRMRYQTFKQTVKQYIYSNDTDRANIEAYIKNYDQMNSLFESLKLEENWNQSVRDAGGIDSDQVKNLVEKYLTLQAKNEALDRDKYSNETLINLEVAEAQLNKLWNAESGDQNLRDVELALDAFDDAIANLKPAGTANQNQEGDGNAENTVNNAPQLPISPLLLGVLVVLVLIASVGGYIGYDIMKHKNLLIKSAKTVNQYNEVVEEDEEGYY